jgi:hypothetical protein
MALVSGEFFDVLGAQPVHGRALRPEDDVVGAARVVVLSHGAWMRHFGGAPDVLQRSIVLHGNGLAHRIVGVMPLGLDYPRGTDFWAPIVPARTRPGTDSADAYVDLVGWLGPSATPAAARDELGVFFMRAGFLFERRVLRGAATLLPRLVVGDVKPALIAFAVVAMLLLLITCINVASLLLVHGLTRMPEIAVPRTRRRRWSSP